MEKIADFKKINLVSEWDIEDCKQLYTRLQLNVYERKRVLFQEGDETDYIYFVNSGEVKLLQKIQIEKSIGQEIEEKMIPKLLVDRRRVPLQKEIAILLEGQVIGLEECLKGGRRQSTAVVSSFEAGLYRMEKGKFLALIERMRESNSSFDLEK